jgi:L-alanine-DL-glutamate epimerase-like enolase superfamily enzyme
LRSRARCAIIRVMKITAIETFVASVSNVKIMESDPDAVPIRDELFTVLPEIKDGQMTIPTGPGWGIELNEKAARTHAWEG